MKKRTKRILIIAAAAALAMGIGYGLLEIGLRPNILAQGEVLLKNKAIEIMNKAVSKTMEGMTDAGDLIQIEKDADGKISMISADSIRMNRHGKRLERPGADRKAGRRGIAHPTGKRHEFAAI